MRKSKEIACGAWSLRKTQDGMTKVADATASYDRQTRNATAGGYACAVVDAFQRA